MGTFRVVKAHAFGNDFLLLDERELGAGVDLAQLARDLCERHRGIGADGLIIYRETARGARMQLLNADGSYSEVSGNGVRCLGAWLAQQRLRPERGDGTKPPARSEDAGALSAPLDIETDAGIKSLTLLGRDGGRFTFRAAMGHPEALTLAPLFVDGQPVHAVTLRVGNPQCVVLGEVSEKRLHALASKLAVHPHFPEGTNVELASVEAPDRVKILIWERGVGPTEASGTGACAAAVAAMAYGGAARDVLVVSPGGAQRVEWNDDGLFLTGWAEVIAEARWVKNAS